MRQRSLGVAESDGLEVRVPIDVEAAVGEPVAASREGANYRSALL
jgi:hypothetical protein